MPRISNAERERRAAADAASGTGGIPPREEGEALDVRDGSDSDPSDEHSTDGSGEPSGALIQPGTDAEGEGEGEGEGETIVLIRMARAGHFADVHPLEVENYGEGGWLPVED